MTSRLIKLIQNKNEKAFENFYNKYVDLIYYVIFQIVGNRNDTDDLTQETFITVYQKIDGYNGGNFKYWVLQIAKNKARNHLKKIMKKPQNNNDFINAVPDTSVSFGQYGRMIAKNFNEEQGRIIILRIIFNFTYDEIAEELNINKTRIFRTFKATLPTLKYLLKEISNE